MDLSVIIISWNTKKLLLDCLESVTRETSEFKSEIIVVDNASSDGSPEAVRKFFPNVKLILSDTNVGFAKANNIGIQDSCGRYICLINSDVIVLKGCFQFMIEYMDRQPKIAVLGPKILNSDRTLQVSCMRLPSNWNCFCRALALDRLFPKSSLFGGLEMTFWNHDEIKNVEVLNGCFWMVKRKALNTIGGLDERFFFYAEDIDWCKRFRDGGWDIVFYPRAEVVHYGGASSSNAPIRFFIEMHRANFQYWAKHHGKVAQISFLLITWLHQIVRISGLTAFYLIRPSSRIQTTYKIERSASCIRWMLSNRS